MVEARDHVLPAVESGAVESGAVESRAVVLPGDRTWCGRLALCLGVVVLLGAAAVFLAPAGSSVAAWWPPAGVSVAMMLWTRRGLQPVTFAGIFVAIGAANALAGREVWLSAGFGAANAFEALAVAALYGCGVRPPVLRTGADFARLVLAGVLGAGTAGVIAGASVAGLAGGQFWESGRAVMASHGAAILLITPLFLVPVRRIWPVARWEWLVQPLVLAGVVVLVFGPRDVGQLAFVTMPFLAWGAARFGVRVASVELLGVGVATSLLTAQGRGPFAAAPAWGDLAPELVGALLQAHLVASALIALPLALLTTQLAQAAARSRATAGQLASLMEAATRTAIVATDQNSVVTYFNSGAESLLGWSADEVVGRETPQLWHDSEEIERRSAELGQPVGLGVVGASVDDRTVAPPGAASSEKRDWTWLTRSGERLVVSLRVSRRYDSAGRWVGWLGIGEDVTRDREAAQALERALERERAATTRAAELDRAKSDFVASVSHELRTPLASILGNTELLLDEGYGPLPAGQRSALERVDRNARRLAALVEELLGFSTADSGQQVDQQQVDQQQVDLCEIVARVRTSMGHAAVDAGVELTTEAETKHASVSGDAAQLEKALGQLVSNAIKHTPRGGWVHLALRRTTETVQVRVLDTGTGIAREDLPHIFDRFYRTPSAVRSALPGVGLGLATVQAIVSGHGGAVEVESELEQGTAVTLILPVPPAETPDATHLQRPMPDGLASRRRKAFLQRRGTRRPTEQE